MLPYISYLVVVEVWTYPKPSCLHTTSASLSSHWSSQIEPHLPAWNTSTRPSKSSSPPTSRRGGPLPERSLKDGMRSSSIHLECSHTHFIGTESLCASYVWAETFRCVCHDIVEVTLTFWWCAHHCCFVSMATVTSDEHPAPALTQGVLITAAT